MSAYRPEVRARARELWLVENLTDTEIAAKVGVARADTIRDWRRAEDWTSLREAVVKTRDAERAREAADAKAALNKRHDDIAGALESMIVGEMKRSAGDTGDRIARIHRMAAALRETQRIRRTALGIPPPAPTKPTDPSRSGMTLADLMRVAADEAEYESSGQATPEERAADTGPPTGGERIPDADPSAAGPAPLPPGSAPAASAAAL